MAEMNSTVTKTIGASNLAVLQARAKLRHELAGAVNGVDEFMRLADDYANEAGQHQSLIDNCTVRAKLESALSLNEMLTKINSAQAKRIRYLLHSVEVMTKANQVYSAKVSELRHEVEGQSAENERLRKMVEHEPIPMNPAFHQTYIPMSEMRASMTDPKDGHRTVAYFKKRLGYFRATLVEWVTGWQYGN